ncbi:MAG: hypothetical protein OEV87_06420 [Phycisphaerae bacterium]|nr:hypothetical protein [Phycisphaerae bacterium]
MNHKNKMQTKKIPVTGALQNMSPKTTAMIVLLAVMGILWGRVLLSGKKGPAAANAQDAAGIEQMTQTAQPDGNLTLKAVALPQVPGRNDTVSHDLFSADRWTAFALEGSQNNDRSDVRADSAENAEKMHHTRLEKIAKRLTLEAVIQDAGGKPFQAFVDGKILSVGSTLTVKEGPDQYELTLEKISEKEVLFMWNKISVVLKMAETFEF